MVSYRPNLKDLNQSFEKNYLLINRLLGSLKEVGEVRQFYINDQLEYALKIIEATKYTHLVELQQLVSKHESLASKVHLPKAIMLIRIYHDARVAEVVESQYTKQIKPRYNYPNKQMHLPDEKQQTQAFLSEWLSLCLSQGLANIELSSK